MKTPLLLVSMMFQAAAFADSVVSVGPMRESRDHHTATLLPVGTVLLTGGLANGPISTGSGPLSTAEVFDPSTNEFRLVGSMSIARWDHTATLLRNGTVLIVGGNEEDPTAELYDPATETFRRIGMMTTARRAHTSSLLPDGSVLVAGGYAGHETYASTEIFDPLAETFRRGPDMFSQRHAHSATEMRDGRILLAGGVVVGDPDSPASAERLRSAVFYDSVQNAILPAPLMEGTHGWHDALLLPDGKVLMAGGEGPTELYDPITGGNRVFACGGVGPALLLPNGKAFIVAITPRLFDPSDGSCASGIRLLEGWNSLEWSTATLLRNGKVFVAGGYLTPSSRNGPFGTTNQAQLYRSAEALQLQVGRFELDLIAVNPDDGRMSEGGPTRVNDKFGYFWFPRLTNDAQNPEVFVKIVGPMPDGAYLLFYAGLTHVEFWLTVRDTASGKSVTYAKPRGNFLAVAARGDAFREDCAASSCLQLRDLFQVRAVASRGTSALFEGRPLSSRSNVFGFFSLPELTHDPDNPELIVKAVGPLPSGEYILFVAGMTDAEARINFTSVENGVPREYELTKPAADFHADVLRP
jgi:hypothetical protein